MGELILIAINVYLALFMMLIGFEMYKECNTARWFLSHFLCLANIVIVVLLISNILKK